MLLCRVAMGALLLMTLAAPSLACPIEKLAHVMREPLDRYKKTELDAAEVHSLEGARWRIYFRRNGVPHSVIRINFGESGQQQIRASFVGTDGFGMVVTTLLYDAPIEPNRQTRIKERSSIEFLFCEKDNVIYVPANAKDEARTLELVRQANSLRTTLLKSKEIMPYLERLR